MLTRLWRKLRLKALTLFPLNHSRAPFSNIDKYPGYYLYNDDNELQQSFIISKYLPLKSGRILFSPQYSGSYMMFIAENQPMVLVNIDFSGLTHEQEGTVYHNLGEFVIAQDNPVVIVGDFGIPAWSKTFQKFLNKTGLEVKNHVILTAANTALIRSVFRALICWLIRILVSAMCSFCLRMTTIFILC